MHLTTEILFGRFRLKGIAPMPTTALACDLLPSDWHERLTFAPRALRVCNQDAASQVHSGGIELLLASCVALYEISTY